MRMRVEWPAVNTAAFIGALAYMGPKAGRDVFSISGEMADLVFGAVTVVTGVFGTLVGGWLLDRMGATMSNGLLICSGGLLLG
jgi:nitrate/nitrite transporter NarK